MPITVKEGGTCLTASLRKVSQGHGRSGAYERWRGRYKFCGTRAASPSSPTLAGESPAGSDAPVAEKSLIPKGGEALL